MIKSLDGEQTTSTDQVDSMREFMAICPKCQTMETVYIVDGTLLNTKKFRQIQKHVFHTCGAVQPCRLILIQ